MPTVTTRILLRDTYNQVHMGTPMHNIHAVWLTYLCDWCSDWFREAKEGKGQVDETILIRLQLFTLVRELHVW